MFTEVETRKMMFRWVREEEVGRIFHNFDNLIEGNELFMQISKSTIYENVLLADVVTISLISKFALTYCYGKKTG